MGTVDPEEMREGRIGGFLNLGKRVAVVRLRHSGLRQASNGRDQHTPQADTERIHVLRLLGAGREIHDGKTLSTFFGKDGVGSRQLVH
jgi:hypothetical protein